MLVKIVNFVIIWFHNSRFCNNEFFMIVNFVIVNFCNSGFYNIVKTTNFVIDHFIIACFVNIAIIMCFVIIDSRYHIYEYKKENFGSLGFGGPKRLLPLQILRVGHVNIAIHIYLDYFILTLDSN